MDILGAGLSGLLAACMFPEATVYERNSEDAQIHKALLRFRTSAVGDAVGIEFRPVQVHKGIWLDGKFEPPSIRNANLYSKKVLDGRLMDRSVWNLEPVVRYIAPEEFPAMLREKCKGRILYNNPIEATDFRSDVATISTLPLNFALKMAANFDPITFGLYEGELKFERWPIRVDRYRILKRSDVYQTVYFPGEKTSVYRASITGDMVIVESIGKPSKLDQAMDTWPEAFGLYPGEYTQIDSVEQHYGKIEPIENDALRKRMIFELTSKLNIYSLGRFAVWKNILQDDVLKDIFVIKKLLNSNIYDRKRISAK